MTLVRPLTRPRAGAGLTVLPLFGVVVVVALVSALALPGWRTIGALAFAALLAVIGFAFMLTRPVGAVIALWFLLLLQNALTALFARISPSAGSAFSKMDDALLVAGTLVLLLRVTMTHERPKLHRVPLVLFSCLIVGLASGVVAGDLGLWTPIGAWLGLKFWSVLILTLLVPWRVAHISRLYTIFMRVGLVVALLGVVDFAAPSVLRVLHPKSAQLLAFRGGGGVESIFNYSGRFAEFMTAMFALAVAHLVVHRRRADLWYALLFAVMAASSLRLKGALAIAAVLVALLVLVPGRRGRRALVVGVMLFAGIIALSSQYGGAISQRFDTFTSTYDQTSRGRLYSTSLAIAEQHAPLGAGYGMFGGYASVLFYSPLYDQYDLSGLYGFTRADPAYLTDTSWPEVLGETGFLGLIIFVVGLVLYFAELRRRALRAPPEVSFAAAAAITMTAALLANSLGGAELFDSLEILTVTIFAGVALQARHERPADAVAVPVEPGDSERKTYAANRVARVRVAAATNGRARDRLEVTRVRS